MHIFRTTITSKMNLSETIVKGWKSLTIPVKCSILDVVFVLDKPQYMTLYNTFIII